MHRSLHYFIVFYRVGQRGAGRQIAQIRMDLVDKVLVAFVSTPGVLLVPLIAVFIAGMLFHFNNSMTFAVFSE